MAVRPRLTRSWVVKYLLHLAALGLAFLCAYEMRRALPLEWWMTHPDAGRVLGWAALYALIGGIVEAVFQTERSAWRFVSLREVLALTRNVVVSIGVFALVVFTTDRGLQLPRSVLLLTALFSIAILGGLRASKRFLHDPSMLSGVIPFRRPAPAGEGKPLIVVGPMSAAEPLIRQLLGDPLAAHKPVGIITPLSAEVGLRLHGVPFIQQLDPSTLARDVTTWSAGKDRPHAILFLGDPLRDFAITVETIGELRRGAHQLLRPQTLTELSAEADGARTLREIPLEEFLPRQPINLDPAPVRALIAGKRILVTGAGGSIGSEIARQVVQSGCSHLTLLDHSEFLLFEIDRELAESKASMTRRAVLANVRDENRVREVFSEEKPELVFHAAALKHVTLVENNPAEGVLTNVLGTWNVLQASIASGAGQFVLISSDKAVDPTNVMGATKRIAEALLEMAPEGSTRLSAVRFGNVLGSAGSVVPIFRDQIARGGPVTVTHPEVTRYFMTIPEAVQLVLHSTAVKAARVEDGPSKFLLEMGKPVKILDLARQMIELSGQTPGVDIHIEFTGLKPGEKIAEALADDGEDPKSCVDGILEVVGGGSRGELNASKLKRLTAAAHAQAGCEVMTLVANCVHDIRKTKATFSGSNQADQRDRTC